ncbi:colony stimulating factor 3 (granulocyte) a isoform X1 [Brienomyrus brachyistius]|uniref:colony stimulating factor 3 (granulocyte) a isoform X1 n=2 Tax=Brienomyrus brachyistius TaxID=42636 RepID=UPI0020B371DD|nr:colony stimulating factor 3 (granulocyte) a isoform X1 [Brienomyrus brachyistius]
MFLFIVLLIWLCAPIHPAPVPEYFFMEGAEFRRALKQSQSLVNKILGDIRAADKAPVNSEPNSEPKNLDYMVTVLAIPSAPMLEEISASFTVKMCLDRMAEGLEMYQDLLKVVGDRASSPEKLRDLQADVRDLSAQIHKMRQLAEMETTVQYKDSGLDSRLTGDYEVQVATHRILAQLRDFTQNFFRSLRDMAKEKPGLAV